MSDNELIAQFMGENVKIFPDGVKRVFYKKSGHDNHYRPLNYGTSWDMLMPVVEKIRKVILPELHKAMPPNSATKGDLIDVDISCGFMEVDIKIVYKHVVEFVKWHNSQSSDKQSKQ